MLGFARNSVSPAFNPNAFRLAQDVLHRRRLIDSSLTADGPYADLWKPAPFKTYYGGRDAAKGWSFAEVLIRRARQEKLRVLCTREYQATMRDSVHKLLKDTIARFRFNDDFIITDRAIISKAGSEFIFKGIKLDPDGIKSTEGIDICWVEEGQHVTEDSWDTLMPTIRKEGAEIWTSFNVTDEEAPTYRMLVANPPPGSIVHHVNYDANKYLSQRSRDMIEFMKQNDYEKYLHIYEGQPRKISDAIIFGGRYVVEGFADDLWEKADRLFFGADFGFANDPSTLVRSFILDNILHVEYEAGGAGIEFAGNMTDDGRGELEQMYDEVPGSRQWPIHGDSARPETISFLRGKGFNISAADKWAGSVEDGITHLKGFKQIIIHPRCKNTAQEFRTYSYKKDPKNGEVLPIIVDKFNHYIDAIRYSLNGYIQRRGATGVWTKLGAS